ncbi:MAG: molecular chaperone DnaJ, partial [Myxococcales bacterium]|nr:molecular chaperone DnaJ [Myxococcales bacterium]
QALRLVGQGQGGRLGGPPGNLYVRIEVIPDDRFQRDGSDLVHELHLTYPQAVLGDKVTIPTLDGEETIKIPSGVQPGDTMVVEKAGIPRLDGRGRGNLIAVIQVDVPKKISRKGKKLLEELKKELAN